MTSNDPALAGACLSSEDEPHLTGREMEVLLLAAEGLSSKQIARTLAISVRTVDEHIDSMRQRSGSRNRTELVARCYAAGILITGVWPPSWSGVLCIHIAADAWQNAT
jgi:DNA-binding CsgD family transcriptional regulator